MNNPELLKRLCTASGISGDEGSVREIILSEITGYCDDIKIDNLGNIIAFKKGEKTPPKKLMLSAHMDEVGLMVTDIRFPDFLFPDQRKALPDFLPA